LPSTTGQNCPAMFPFPAWVCYWCFYRRVRWETQPKAARVDLAMPPLLLRWFAATTTLRDRQGPAACDRGQCRASRAGRIFAKYRSEVREMYDSFDGALPWIVAFRPTTQALAIVRVRKSADREGLNAEDYDGPRWDNRTGVLQHPSPASESDLIRFDLALTVSAMSYISDLHLGRINPLLFHLKLDIDHTT